MRRLGLALSGGGFRATLYHLGAKDWAAYIYIPVIFALLILLPHYGYKYYRHAQVARVLTTAVAETRADFSRMLSLLENGPARGDAVRQHEPGAL